jgi:hypothetical protein
MQVEFFPIENSLVSATMKNMTSGDIAGIRYKTHMSLKE